MSEIDLTVLDAGGKERQDPEILTSMQEIDLALKECGIGWFHVLLMTSSFVGLIAGVLVTNTTPYILPIAECDLNMNLIQKGLLNAMPYIGMTIVSIVAGFLTDTFGRKIFLVYGFGGLFIFTIIGGSSQSYEVLVMVKFFEGILFAISFSPTLTITSEFCYKEIRDRVVLFRSSFTAFAQILVAAMSWGILTHDWNYSLFNGYIELHVWNFYIYLMSLWAFFSFVLYAILPESPRFYLSQKKYNEARKILIKMYTMNTGKPAETYKYIDLWKDKEEEMIEEEPERKIMASFKHQLITGLLNYIDLWKNKEEEMIEEEPERKIMASFKHQLITGLLNVKPMLRKPLLGYLLLISGLNFLSMALYNVIRLWFPQLSAIVEHYSNIDGENDLCGMLDSYTHDQKIRSVNTTSSEVCVPTRSGNETYINSIILGCVCIIPFALSGILVNKVGKKNLYIAAGLICVCITLAIRWADSKVAVVALFSVDTAISQTMIGLFQALTLELFPTTIRTLAISVIMTFGRIGTLVGNVAFPVLLNMGCVVPFYSLTGVMICVTIMALFLPKS
ncbi:Synaptic vesicle glycoprotein 2B [Papilio machaon]|uniref:Synaptic vesicle glycoprotein 2B n=1 Tax=Papilio machaon TaxID=76193 RepID=A0A194QYS5_PAPMA|nr:Synaptic vesicle glycoprotein 2B [Papilio machaon]